MTIIINVKLAPENWSNISFNQNDINQLSFKNSLGCHVLDFIFCIFYLALKICFHFHFFSWVSLLYLNIWLISYLCEWCYHYHHHYRNIVFMKIVLRVEFCYEFRSSSRRCSVKMVFLKILQNSQENTYARFSFLIKLQASGLQLY